MKRLFMLCIIMMLFAVPAWADDCGICPKVRCICECQAPEWKIEDPYPIWRSDDWQKHNHLLPNDRCFKLPGVEGWVCE